MRDLTFRYSMINTAHFCLSKAKLQYIDGAKPPGLTSINLIFGTAIHMAIEVHFDGGNAINAFDMFWSTVTEDECDWTYSRYDFKALKRVGREMLRKWLKLHAKNYIALKTELPLEGSINGFKLTGTLDFLGYYKGELSIVDWKTSGKLYDKRKALVDGQMWIYYALLNQMTESKVLPLDELPKQIVYAPFIKYGARAQTPIVETVTENKLKSMLDNATLVMRDLSTRQEFPRNEQNCLRCEYFNTCYPEETKNELR